MAVMAAVLAFAAAAASLPATAQAGSTKPGLCQTANRTTGSPPYLALLSAFPAELAPLVAAARIDATVEAGGQRFHVGTIDGVSVVLGLLGIGMINAERSARNVLESFDVAAVVVAGVAGSSHRIGDVVVPRRWIERGRRRSSRANQALLALARRAAEALVDPLERCTTIPPSDPNGELRCLPFEPAVVFERKGVSGDSFGDSSVPCVAGGGEIFGCELPVPTSSASSASSTSPISSPSAAAAPAMLTLPSSGRAAGTATIARQYGSSRAPVGGRANSIAGESDASVEDMETAAAARVARRHRVPFLALRAVSDGAGDPLGDRGFPAQFFDYYRLAASNAGTIASHLAREIDAVAGDPSQMQVCELLASHRWRAAASRLEP